MDFNNRLSFGRYADYTFCSRICGSEAVGEILIEHRPISGHGTKKPEMLH